MLPNLEGFRVAPKISLLDFPSISSPLAPLQPRKTNVYEISVVPNTVLAPHTFPCWFSRYTSSNIPLLRVGMNKTDAWFGAAGHWVASWPCVECHAPLAVPTTPTHQPCWAVRHSWTHTPKPLHRTSKPLLPRKAKPHLYYQSRQGLASGTVPWSDRLFNYSHVLAWVLACVN